jgi:hypothetical protein
MEDLKALLIVILKNQALILSKIENIENTINDIDDETLTDARWIEHQLKVNELDRKIANSRLSEFLLEAKGTKHELKKYEL